MKKILFLIFIHLILNISKSYSDTLEDYYLRKIVDPKKATNIYNDVIRFSKEFNVDERLITAVMETESAFVTTAKSKKGAIGLMQLMPGTAELLNVNPFNTTENIYGGVKYLKELLDKNNNDLRLTLASYNAGYGNVLKYNSIPPFEETQKYVYNVLNLYNSLKDTKIAKNSNIFSNEFTNSNFTWEN